MDGVGMVGDGWGWVRKGGDGLGWVEMIKDKGMNEWG